MSGISSVIVLDANGLRVYDSKDAVIVFGKHDPEEKGGAEVKISPEKISITAESIKDAKIIPCCPIGKKIEVDIKTNPEKDKFISQVLDELGLGESNNFSDFLYGMAKKVIELCYEVKQLKGN